MRVFLFWQKPAQIELTVWCFGGLRRQFLPGIEAPEETCTRAGKHQEGAQATPEPLITAIDTRARCGRLAVATTFRFQWRTIAFIVFVAKQVVF